MPSLEPWQWVIGLVAILGAFAAIWRILRYIFRVDKALPVLIKIAEDYELNKKKQKETDEKLDHIVSSVDEQSVRNNWAVKIAEDSRLIAQTNAKIVEALTETQSAEATEMRGYLHSKMHELANQVAVMNLQASVTEQRSARIEQRLDDLIPLVIRNRKDDE